MLTPSIEDRRARAAYLVDELLGAYACAVDERDFTAWLDLFAPECAYQVHAMENVREAAAGIHDGRLPGTAGRPREDD